MSKSSPRQPAGLTLKIAIPPDAEGQRLDKALTLFLAGKEPALSRARLQALMEQKLITREGKPVKNANVKVKEGEVYYVHVPPPEPAEPRAQKMPLTIVYEDKDLLVIDKPVGMVVHPAPGNREGTLVNALLAHCGKSLSGVGGIARPGIVHRLDKDTSGLMVVAKNDTAHQALSKQFADRSLSRTYKVVVWGVPDLLAGEIEAPIGRHPHDRKKMTVLSKGKAALTYYKVLETFDVASLIECKLATGRTHQIRVHLMYIKHPVVGDPVYGRKRAPTANKVATLLHAFPRQALHAGEIKFQHPRSGKKLRFRSEMPKDMVKLLRSLEIFQNDSYS